MLTEGQGLLTMLTMLILGVKLTDADDVDIVGVNLTDADDGDVDTGRGRTLTMVMSTLGVES